MFQSIYSWKVLWKRIRTKPISTEVQFQSIYSWKVLWKATEMLSIVHNVTVSIHLFMEGTLEGNPKNHLDQWLVGFNPSIHGRYFGSGFNFLHLPAPTLFQSIYSWKVLWKYSGNIKKLLRGYVSIHLFMEGTLEGG